MNRTRANPKPTAIMGRPSARSLRVTLSGDGARISKERLKGGRGQYCEAIPVASTRSPFPIEVNSPEG